VPERAAADRGGPHLDRRNTPYTSVPMVGGRAFLNDPPWGEPASELENGCRLQKGC